MLIAILVTVIGAVANGASAPGAAATSGTTTARWWHRLSWVAVVLLATGAGVGGMIWLDRETAVPPPPPPPASSGPVPRPNPFDAHVAIWEPRCGDALRRNIDHVEDAKSKTKKYRTWCAVTAAGGRPVTIYLSEYDAGVLARSRPRNDKPAVVKPGIAYVTDARDGAWTHDPGWRGRYTRYVFHDGFGQTSAKYWLETSGEEVSIVADVPTGTRAPREEDFDAALAALRAQGYQPV